jgi:hypothetical protein
MANNHLNIDKNRGAYITEIIEFYKDLEIYYLNEFLTTQALMEYLEVYVKCGEKKKFALGYCYDETIKRQIEQTLMVDIISPGLGHFVALRIDKTNEKKYTFRTIDFQLLRDDPRRVTKDKLPDEAKPPFYLFEKSY